MMSVYIERMRGKWPADSISNCETHQVPSFKTDRESNGVTQNKTKFVLFWPEFGCCWPEWLSERPVQNAITAHIQNLIGKTVKVYSEPRDTPLSVNRTIKRQSHGHCPKLSKRQFQIDSARKTTETKQRYKGNVIINMTMGGAGSKKGDRKEERI